MGRKSYRSGSKSARKLPRRVGLSVHQEALLKAKLRLTTPSEPWVEAQIQTVVDQDTDGSSIVYRYRDPHAFPPGQEQTLMVRCRECEIFNPPNTIEHGNCLDHARHEGWGPSPSALAIAALRRYYLELEDLELLPEDAKSLQREIEKFTRKSAIPARAQRKCKSRRRKGKQEPM